jgi:hypothetical protein
LLNLGLRVLGRWWRRSVTPGPSSQSSSTQGWASTATSASTPLRCFFLSSCLLEASQQPIGSADRHPSENIREGGKFTHVTHQHTHESKANMKIILIITYTQGESIKTRITPLRSKHTSSMSNTLAPPRLTQTLGVAATSQRSNTLVQSQKGSVYKVWHDSLHALEHARGCMEQLMETTSTLHYSRSCPRSALYSVRAFLYEAG